MAMALNIPSGGGSSDPGVMMDINTTPLIDVMLVLLVMLIITIPIQRHEVNLDLPVGAPPSLAVPVDVVTINVDFDGAISWNNQAVPDQATLERNLRAVATATPQPEVHVRPNKLVPFKHVAAILASARRLDVTKIGLVGNEQW
jgi:biopolymer transport protein ExbD